MHFCHFKILIIVIILSGCEIEINRSSEYENETEADQQIKTLKQPVAICSEDTEFIDWQEELLSENGYKPLRVMRDLQECLFLEKKQAESAKSILGVAF
jgi:hypothetical protein